MSARSPFSQFPVPDLLHEKDLGWRGKFSKWQWALVIGIPLAAAAALAGLTLVVSRRRRRDSGSQSPQPSMSPTPVASPTSTTTKRAAAAETSDKDRAQDLKQQGNEMFKQGKLEEAAQCYEEAIQLSVGDGEKDNIVAIYHQNLAAVYNALVKKDTDPDQKTSHSELVIENCDRAVALNPRYVKALLRRFKMHQALGHKEEALLDATRVLLLDESHAQSLSSSVTELLRDLSQADAAKTFPELEPLAPTKYLVKTYSESYIWKDDISEERLMALWLQAHTPPTDQSESADMSHDASQEKAPEQNNITEKMAAKQEVEGRGEGGGEGVGGGEGGGEEVVGVKGKGEGGGEEGDKGTEEGGSEVKENGEGEGEEKEGNHAADEVEDKTSVAMVGFAEEPFVQAAAQFQHYELTDLLDLLTQAIDKGHAVFRSHALLLRGSLHALWRMENDALRDLQEVINTQGLPAEMYVNALIKRAGIFAGRQNISKCKTCLEKAAAIAPDSIDIFVHRARVSLETEDVANLDAVIEDLTKAVNAAPDQPYPLYSLASSYHRLASVKQSMQLVEVARVKFQDAIKRFPKFADGLILYALFLQDTNDFQQAEQILNKVVQIEPDNPLGHFSLGLLQLVVQSNIDQTMVHMQKAIAVDISCVQAYDTIASIEMQRDNIARAMELYEKAVRYSRNQVEMTQAYVAQKVFTMQERVCKEYGVAINQLSRSTSLPTGSPGT